MTKGTLYNYREPIEVAEGVYWVGFYDERASFPSNPYLMIDGEEVVVFDPASITEHQEVTLKIMNTVDPAKISYIVVHHPDPDICSALPSLQGAIKNNKLKVATFCRNRLFLHYYGVVVDYYDVDRHDYKLTLKSGRTLRFILTPHCHYPTAIMTYDEKQKILFSSDIFGTISFDWSLFAKEGYEEQMRLFHTGYMASNRHMRAVMEKVEELDIDIILPQHGSIIKGEMIPRCIEFLKNLDCGIDSAFRDEELYRWIPE